MPPIPGEILNQVFRYLKDDKQTLSSCACVSRLLWLPFASEYLFRAIVVRPPPESDSDSDSFELNSPVYASFASFLAGCPRAQRCIRSLTIAGDIGKPSSQLRTDLLVTILQHLPALLEFRLCDLHLALPADSNTVTTTAYTPNALKRLIIHYPPHTYEWPAPIHPLAVLRLFSFVEHLHLEEIPRTGSTLAHIPHVADAGMLHRPRVESLRLGGFELSARGLCETLLVLGGMIPSDSLVMMQVAKQRNMRLDTLYLLLDRFVRQAGLGLRSFSTTAIADDSMEALGENVAIHALTSVRSLEELEFSYLIGLKDEYANDSDSEAEPGVFMMRAMLAFAFPAPDTPEPFIKALGSTLSSILLDQLVERHRPATTVPLRFCRYRRDTDEQCTSWIIQWLESANWSRLETVLRTATEVDAGHITMALQYMDVGMDRAYPLDDELKERAKHIILGGLSSVARKAIRII